MKSKTVQSNGTISVEKRRWLKARNAFLKSSGLDKSDIEIRRSRKRPNSLSIIYRDPLTDQRMKTPDGRIFRRYRAFDSSITPRYLTCHIAVRFAQINFFDFAYFLFYFMTSCQKTIFSFMTPGFEFGQ